MSENFEENDVSQHDDKKLWFEGDEGEDLDASFKDYDITASPNDFNVLTISNFVESGAVVIPGFQRNYVWDKKRASKLIESLLIGLPIPQLFLYEAKRNSFLVVDGQQRMMSIYYFVKKRFPRKDRRPDIRRIVSENNGILPASVFSDDKYFEKFNLDLPGIEGGRNSRFHGVNYDTLDEHQLSFNLRTVRNVVIKQTSPSEEDDTSVFEIFHRLNTGGVNLRPQEIRASLYHSPFMNALGKVNLNPVWRRLLGMPEPDLHAKDIEILLRSIALTLNGDHYKEPMSRFLSIFAKQAASLDQKKADDAEKIEYIVKLFEEFFRKVSSLQSESFAAKGSRRFNIAVFESVFRAACTKAAAEGSFDIPEIRHEKLIALKEDQKFIDATRFGVGRAIYVAQRFERAKAILQA